MNRIGRLAALVTLTLSLLIPSAAFAAGQLRIGTLAPKNSLYHRQLMEVGEAWRNATGDGAKYQIGRASCRERG